MGGEKSERRRKCFIASFRGTSYSVSAARLVEGKYARAFCIPLPAGYRATSISGSPAHSSFSTSLERSVQFHRNCLAAHVSAILSEKDSQSSWSLLFAREMSHFRPVIIRNERTRFKFNFIREHYFLILDNHLIIQVRTYQKNKILHVSLKTSAGLVRFFLLDQDVGQYFSSDKLETIDIIS